MANKKQKTRSGCLLRTLRQIGIVTAALIILISGQLVWRVRPEVDLRNYPPLISEVSGDSFTITDPYDYPGQYYKTQLHTHTNKSLDGNWEVEVAVKAYKDAGYSYLAITDHDKVTIYKDLDDSAFITIAGEENTINYPFWPLGQHMIRLFVDEHARWGKAQDRIDLTREAGGITGLAHISWVGNLGTGKWSLPQMLAVEGYTLVEVFNGHSNTGEDTRRWHELLRRLGPTASVWATAVDDAHDLKMFNAAWVWVKTDGFSQEALKEGLQRGSFYATRGPEILFGVRDGKITVTVESDEALSIRFIAADGEAVYEAQNSSYAEYDPTGHEGFIRVEATDTKGYRAWSQPFWLIPKAATI